MKHAAKSIRAFIGTLNFEESKRFYKEKGFIESPISRSMSYIKVTDQKTGEENALCMTRPEYSGIFGEFKSSDLK